MRVKLSPIRSDKQINYTFGHDSFEFQVTGDGNTIEQQGVYDLSSFTDDGSLEDPPFPIIQGYREDGTLYLELINFYQSDAPESVLFPKWEEVNKS
ncbi:hypothetical protein E2L07_05795 [Halalkalibacterium halodurans]|uniref:hypothetical protein n=1 Tax=Halalkalibacterium halodurans TaxID=86665 RepID=UPI0010689B7C|nr:hypothetical protein [Halalkalibacterium halodurans]TES56197.1 hypothetical protein E2L07_05795 [Halalkalibacterium halodurans]